MRIVVFTTWFPDDSAPSTAPFNLSHAQAIATKHEVHVFHVRLGAGTEIVSEVFGGVSVTRMPLRMKRPWEYLAVARELAGALQSADVLHTMAFTSAVVAAPIQALSRAPWVHTEHWSGMADPASVSKLWAALAWLRNVLKFPGAVTAVSTAQAADLARFARRGAMHVVPNVVEQHGDLATRAGQGTGVVRIVSVGGLIERKRPELAMEVVRVLKDRGVDASLTWVGDGPLRAELEAAAGAAGISDRFTVTGLLPPQRVHVEMRNADVFLLPTRHETFCVSAAEAVVAGLPVVVTDLPAVRDFLSGSNSVLVTGDTGESYADGVQQALETFAAVPSTAISDTLGDSLGSDSIGKKFTKIYRTLAVQHKPGPAAAQGSWR